MQEQFYPAIIFEKKCFDTATTFCQNWAKRFRDDSFARSLAVNH